jgi:hypothetical protein
MPVSRAAMEKAWADPAIAKARLVYLHRLRIDIRLQRVGRVG